MDEIFSQFQQRYQQLRLKRDAGQLSPQQFMAELEKLRWQDNSQAWWKIDPEGVFLRYDGLQWVPVRPAQMPPNPPPPVQGPPKPQTAKPGRPLRKIAPILALIPSLLCGSVWFLYTSIGAFKSKGLGGVDFITPLIVVGLPLLFWAFKKPIDKLLLPLKPSIRRVPKPLRLGIALAIPLLLSCGCSSLIPSGYLALNVTSFVSVMTAAVLLRF